MSSVLAFAAGYAAGLVVSVVCVCVGAWMQKRAGSVTQCVWPLPPKSDTSFFEKWSADLSVDGAPKDDRERVRA